MLDTGGRVDAALTTPDLLRFEQTEKPVPADHDVLIRIHATTVESTDALFRSGRDLSARMATGFFPAR